MLFRRTRKTSPEAEKAVQEAQAHLQTVQSREPEVHRIAEASKRFRRENHFAESLQRLFEHGGDVL